MSNSVVSGSGTVDVNSVDGEQLLVSGVLEVVISGKEEIVPVECGGSDA